MNADEKNIRRLVAIGVANFETVDATQRLQHDMRRQLDRLLSDHGRLAGLDDCSERQCGKLKCSAVCQFGTRSRRQAQIAAVHHLLQKTRGPLFEVRVGRGAWGQPAGKLEAVSIAAAKQLNRRAFDQLYQPDLIAVGTFKVSVAPESEGAGWTSEIHQIVGGATKAELEKAFSTSRPDLADFLSVKKVTNLGQAISDVLRLEVASWQHPLHSGEPAPRPNKARRAEYYAWLLDLEPDDRMIRYGCDRHFNKLKKKPRVVRQKALKGHPNPTWLARYQFGSHPQNCRCVRCEGPYPLN
jgi:hypothetical protein